MTQNTLCHFYKRKWNVDIMKFNSYAIWTTFKIKTFMEIQKYNEQTAFESWEDKNRMRANERYHTMVEQNNQIKRAEALLAHLGKQWGFGKPIPAMEFEKVEYPYFVSTGGAIRENAFAFVVGKYSYSFFDNFTFKIYENE